MIEQVTPRKLLDAALTALRSPGVEQMRKSYAGYPFSMDAAQQNLAAAYRAGVTLTTGTDSGNPLLLHGPALHRELQLWVAAGLPSKVALKAATYQAARLLRAENRIGLVKAGHDATLLLVDGNPLEDIAATERISSVFVKGELINRQRLFEKE
jgi:imidazolonepropionase-like amidohydrolase